jgi:hypothetical protein
MDGYGRLIPATNRFPSGFASLAAYVHGKGLKFGFHIMRGIPRQAVDQNTPIWHSRYHAADIADRVHVCAWNPDMYGIDMSKPGAQDYYDSIAALYASWGVDFVKADDMSRPYEQRRPEVVALSEALRKTGRKIVLSLSPGPAPVKDAADLRKWAQMWRISDDFWDDWKLLRQQFDYTRDWASYAGIADTWPDADMLPLGKLRVSDAGHGPQDSKFTADERQTVMTLWSIFRSPLIFGGDLPTTDEATFQLITNPEVLAVDQHSSGNRQVYDGDNIRVWTAGQYVAVFNLSEQSRDVNLAWGSIGLSRSSWKVRDLWVRSDLGSKSQLSVTLRPHASALFLVSK